METKGAHGGQALQPLATGAGADRRPPRAVDAVRCPVGVLASLTAVSAFASLDVTSVVSFLRDRGAPISLRVGWNPSCRPLLRALPPASTLDAARRLRRSRSPGP